MSDEKPIEKIWEYDCNFTFNSQLIVKFTITDHYQIKHSQVVNNVLIGEIVNTLENQELDPEPKKENVFRDVFVWELIHYNNKKYRLIFWFEDGITSHLWVRNCYPID